MSPPNKQIKPSYTSYNNRNINDLILHHENSTEKWEYFEMVKVLTVWIERFNFEFKLKITTPCLVIDKKSSRYYGRYRYGFNGIGTKHEITINARHLSRPLFDILDTLLHEMLHQWQDMYGKPGRSNYHNNEFIEKALSIGISSDSWGHSLGIVKDGLFEKMLIKYGINTEGIQYYNPQFPQKVQDISQGKSKLKKWTCGCQNAWIGKSDFEAKCKICGNTFVLV